MMENNRNWAGNYQYSAARWHYPETLAELQTLVKNSSKLKVLGSRHSFNSIADTAGDLVSLERLQSEPVIDKANQTVTVAAGTRYGQLCHYLHQEGYAIHNLASLPHISVAGACATATHGSGDHNGNLATAVAGLEMVTAAGDLVTLTRSANNNELAGAVVGLGAVGIVTALTLDLVPTFEMRQYVYENVPFSQVEDHFEEIFASAYSVSLFTDWQGDSFNQLWVKHKTTAADNFEPTPELYGATAAAVHRHPITALSAENCTAQLGLPGSWYERLPHFRMEFTPSSGSELQSEYFVPRKQVVAAFQAVRTLSKQIGPLLMISEVRTIAADELWLSPCYQQASVGLHFTWEQNWAAVKELLPLLEAQLAPFQARPHWGKLFTMSAAQIAPLYSKLPDFQQLLNQFDPQGKFRNPYIDNYIWGGSN